MSISNLTILGCGGHAKVVLDALALSGQNFNVELCDDNPELMGKKIAGYVVKATKRPYSAIEGYVHVAIGSNSVRENLYKRLPVTTALLTIIHPSAVIASSAEVGKGSFIAATAILGPECCLAEGCIINHGAVVDHEVKIGAYSHIAPNSTLGGRVIVGSGVLIGAGAVVLPNIKIGDGTIVGAGAVVTRDLPPNTTVKGIPAK